MKNEIKSIWFLMLFTLLFTVACGCGKKETKTQELILLCGSSFLNPANELCREFTQNTGVQVLLSIAGSEDFLPLVKAGSQGDLLITHDPYLDYVSKADALAESVHVGFVSPVVAVQKGNPKKIRTLSDLARPSLKVALSNPKYSTCGEMVFELLKKKGLREGVLKSVGNRLTKGHSRLGTLLKTGAVDAVVMWNGVAHTFRESLTVVPIPYEYEEEIRVHIIGLKYSKQAKSMRRFLSYARKRGPSIFAVHGYQK